jgi:hypothetical protein
MFTEFSEEQWNHFYTTAAHCLRFHLSIDEKLTPAMDNVTKRNLLGTMGFNFHDWAIAYFSTEGGNLDRLLVREEAFNDFKMSNSGKWTAQSFLERVKAFCRYYGYILNPKKLIGKQGKIIKKTEVKKYDSRTCVWEIVPGLPKVAKEMIYIQSLDELTVEGESDEPVEVLPF